MKRVIVSVLLSGVCLLTGCSIKATLPYTPVSTSEIDAHVEVQDFKYITPETKKKMKPNQLQNTAAGSIYLTENVDTFFTNALKRELRQSGVSIKEIGGCSLQGELEELLIDDLGYSVDYKSRVHYLVKGEDGETLYDSTKDVDFNSSKFVVASVFFANVNKIISDNISQLLKDKNFYSAIESKCHKK